jgi:hypothetical protein
MQPDDKIADLPPLRTLAHRLVALAVHIKRMDSGSGDAALMIEAASEIMRLRGIVRANAMRHGAMHPEVDAVIYPEASHAA